MRWQSKEETKFKADKSRRGSRVEMAKNLKKIVKEFGIYSEGNKESSGFKQRYKFLSQDMFYT